MHVAGVELRVLLMLMSLCIIGLCLPDVLWQLAISVVWHGKSPVASCRAEFAQSLTLQQAAPRLDEPGLSSP